MTPSTLFTGFFRPERDRQVTFDNAERNRGFRFGSGWHHGSDPVWSRRQTAELIIAEQAFPDASELSLRVFAHGAAPDNPQFLTITSHGIEAQRYRIETHEAVEVTFPLPHFQDGYALLSLTCDWIKSPFSIQAMKFFSA